MRSHAYATAAALAALLCSAHGTRAETAWDACLKTPTRVCVLAEALRIEPGVGEPAGRATLLAQIATAQAQGGQAKEASQTLQRAAEEGKGLAGEDRNRFVPEYATGLANVGRYADAEGAVTTLADGYHATFVRAGFAEIQQRAGLGADAAKTLARAADIAASLGDREAALSLMIVAKAQARAGLDADSARTFERALVAARQVSSEGGMISRVAAALAEAGRIDDSVALEKTDPNRPKVFPLQTIAQAEIKAGKFEEARRLAETIDYVDVRGPLLAEIAIAQSKAGGKLRAQGILNEVEGLAETAEFDRAEILAAAAVGRAETGDSEASKKDFEKARELADAVDDDKLRQHALAVTGLALWRAGRESDALKILTPGPDSVDRTYLIGIFAKEAADAGRFATALQAVDLLGDPEGRAYNLAITAPRLPN